MFNYRALLGIISIYITTAASNYVGCVFVFACGIAFVYLASHVTLPESLFCQLNDGMETTSQQITLGTVL